MRRGWRWLLIAGLAGCEAASARAPGADHATARPARANPTAPSPTAAPSEAPPPRQRPAAGGKETRPPTDAELARYPWLSREVEVRALVDSFAPPSGYQRVALEPASFGGWLRELPLRAPGSPVRSFTGQVLREEQRPGVAAVAELDVGTRDLQQCADSVIRLHAEWLWASNRQADIRYHTTSGDLAVWSRYAAGERPTIEAQKMTWAPAAKADRSRKAFRAYLDIVFGYAGTGSLAARGQKRDGADVAPGDFFVLPGSPGHTILVLDVATDRDGHKVALLGQGFMPAQDFQVLSDRSGPWFSLEVEAVDTPFWPVPFPWSSLRRLPD